MRGAELGGGAGDPAAADFRLELVYAGGGFGAVVRSEGAVASAATSAAAAAAAGSDIQRLESLQFGEYRAILRCGDGGKGLLYHVAAGGRRGQGGEMCVKLRHERGVWAQGACRPCHGGARIPCRRRHNVV